tara:strand:- start:494 stop:841 length:348 start_codon:yes stop_codon:yes gene_type:complete
MSPIRQSRHQYGTSSVTTKAKKAAGKAVIHGERIIGKHLITTWPPKAPIKQIGGKKEAIEHAKKFAKRGFGESWKKFVQRAKLVEESGQHTDIPIATGTKGKGARGEDVTKVSQL